MAEASLSPASAATWPTPNGSQAVTSTIPVSGTKDYGMKRLYGSGDLGTGGQNEDQDPILELAPGAVLKNVIIGAPAARGDTVPEVVVSGGVQTGRCPGQRCPRTHTSRR